MFDKMSHISTAPINAHKHSRVKKHKKIPFWLGPSLWGVSPLDLNKDPTSCSIVEGFVPGTNMS